MQARQKTRGLKRRIGAQSTLCSFQIRPLCPGEIKKTFQHVAAFNELSCLTSLLENFSLIEPGSEASFAPLHNKGGLDDFGARDNEDATKMLSQIPLEMRAPTLHKAAR